VLFGSIDFAAIYRSKYISIMAAYFNTKEFF